MSTRPACCVLNFKQISMLCTEFQTDQRAVYRISNRPACCVLDFKQTRSHAKSRCCRRVQQPASYCCNSSCCVAVPPSLPLSRLPQFECHAVLLQEEAKSLKYPLARDYLNYVKWRITVHFKKLDNPKVSVLLKLVILLFLATWSLTWSRPASSDTTKFE